MDDRGGGAAALETLRDEVEAAAGDTDDQARAGILKEFVVEIVVDSEK